MVEYYSNDIRAIRDSRGVYYCKTLVDIGFYPNYSFEVGDIDGDGIKEIAVLTTDGGTLRVFRIDGSLLFERTLRNHGCWGTPTITFSDLDGDGKEELIVPDGSMVIALDDHNDIVRKTRVPTSTVDDYGIAIPLIGVFKREGKTNICVAAAGGGVFAFDDEFRLLWSIKGLRKDFGHEFNISEIPNNESIIAFSNVDHIRYASAQTEGELILVDSSGRLLLKKRVRDLIDDTHFDDVAIADFTGNGRLEVLVEKGILMDLKGNVIWNASKCFDHGQWIAHLPDPRGPGRLSFIAELWGYKGKSRMLDSKGKTLWTLGEHRHTKIDQNLYPGCKVAPTRVHAIDWKNNGEYEIVLAEQIVPSREFQKKDIVHKLKIFVFNPMGELLAEIPFVDTRKGEFFYNGEVHSRAVDMDNDGNMEFVFPRQDGKVMVIGKS